MMNNSFFNYVMQSPEIEEYITNRQMGTLRNLILLHFIEPLGGIVPKEICCWCSIKQCQGQVAIKKISQLLERLGITDMEFEAESEKPWLVWKKLYMGEPDKELDGGVACWNDFEISLAIAKILLSKSIRRG